MNERGHIKDEAFLTSYKRLNKGQKLAVDTIEGPVMVLAGPGTGKTQVLTLRIANILRSTDIPPDAVLALTYTNSGVSAMRERLKSFVGQHAYRVNIHTFHGYASTVIESHPTFFPRIIGALSADDVDRYDIVRTAIVDVHAESLRPPGNPEYYVKPILSLIGALKNDRVTADEYRHYINSLGKDSAEEDGEPSSKLIRSEAFLDVFVRYEALMRERNFYDYSDMLIELINALLEHNELRLELGESAQYILADEHQDANSAQNRILELLAGAHVDGDMSPNLFIVGDDKQAIYRFQGASLQNFLYFKERFPRAVTIPLTHNYRSTEAILESGARLMEGRALQNEPLISQSGKGECVEMFVADTKEGEVEAVASRIKELVNSGVSSNEIAVLLRKNKDIDAFVRALQAKDIPYVSYRDTDALESSAVQLLIALIRAAVDPFDSAALGKALFLPAFSIDIAVLAKVFSLHNRTREPLFELLMNEPETREAAGFFKKMMKRAHTEDAMETLDELVAESGYLSELMNADALLHALEAYRSIRTLIELRSNRKNAYTLKDTILLLRDLERGVAALPVLREGGGDGVRLSSLHKSKGLEFDHVFLPHALESRFKPRADRALFHIPDTVSRPEPDWDDERRLFFVGITRARKNVYASMHTRRSDDKEEAPLSFLSELGEVNETIVESGSPLPMQVLKKSEQEGAEEYQHIIRMFLERGISATALNAYLRDPWECFIQSILRLPSTKEAHQMYGTAIHAALERFFSTGNKEGKMSDRATLVSAFVTALNREPLKTNDHKAYETRGKEALEGYYEEYKDSFHFNVATEVSVTADLALPLGSSRDSVTVHGFLDKVEYQNGNSARVVDYKTGSPKSRNHIEGKTKDSDGDYKRQLVFYKLLLTLEGRHAMSEGVIDFIEPNDSGKYKQEAFVVTPEEIETLKSDVATMVNDLVTGAFIPKTCESEDSQVRALSDVLRQRFTKIGLE